MTDIIPEGWRKVKLGEICTILKGKGLSKEKLSDSGVYKCILYGELYTTYSEIIKEVKSRTNENEGVLSKKGDILIPASTTTTGIDLANASALDEENVLLGGDINILRKKNNCYNSHFLAYYLTHIKKREIMRLTQGITIIHLYGKDLKEIELILPPKKVQDKIVEIIRSNDEAIEATDKIIKETEKIKKGLMQRLFSDDNGSKYPRVAIETIATVKRGASPRPIAHPKWWSNSGVGWIRIEDVTKANKYLRRTKQYLSEEGIKKSVPVKKGELIMSICGSIGKPVIVDMDACIHDGFVAFKNIKKDVDIEYLYYLLKYLEPVFSGMGQHGTQKNLNSTLVGKRSIPLPQIDEQKKIAQMLSSLDIKITSEEKKKQKLIRLKKALMQKLLTGKIRVKVD